jgi:TPP-dependent pyruvate/acetoin dehydrogenase alpha subunit
LSERAARLDDAQWVAFFRRALLIRRVDEQVSEMIGAEFHGATHFCIGQELTAVAACACLAEGDYVFTTHRNRAHLLARGADPGRLFAELLGRRDGYSGGKAGSFHLAAPDLNVPVTSAMVAGGLPLAVGAALGCRLEKAGRLVLAFFGDGSINEGGFHESVNLATLWGAPLVLVCENNDAVPYDPSGSGLSAPDVAQYVGGYGLHATAVDGGDAEAVWLAVGRAVERARAGGGPSFIEARTRKGPINQSMSPGLPCDRLAVSDAWDPAPGGALPAWRAVDPLLRLARYLLDRGLLDRGGLEAADREVAAEVRRAVEFGRASPPPPTEAATQGVYAS